jgi:hypothetical protein
MPIKPFPSFLKGNACSAYGAYGAYEGFRLSDPEPTAHSPNQVPRLSLEEMMELGFYDLLGCEPGATVKVIGKRFNALSLLYHPDKGGSAVAFRYLKMAADVLKNKKTRAEYDKKGKEPWVKAFARAENMHEPSGAASSSSGPTEFFGSKGARIPAPPINASFLQDLLGRQGALEHVIGDMPFARYIEAALARQLVEEDAYFECAAAESLNVRMRLIATKGIPSESVPVYAMPRVVRYAAFMGAGVVELDMPASWGQQVACKILEP